MTCEPLLCASSEGYGSVCHLVSCKLPCPPAPAPLLRVRPFPRLPSPFSPCLASRCLLQTPVHREPGQWPSTLASYRFPEPPSHGNGAGSAPSPEQPDAPHLLCWGPSLPIHLPASAPRVLSLRPRFTPDPESFLGGVRLQVGALLSPNQADGRGAKLSGELPPYPASCQGLRRG